MKEIDGVYSYCFHKNGRNASIEYLPAKGNTSRKGFIYVFNTKGKKVYERTLSRIGIKSTILLKFHDNGAVKEADYHWYSSEFGKWSKETTHFDNQGNVITQGASSARAAKY